MEVVCRAYIPLDPRLLRGLLLHYVQVEQQAVEAERDIHGPGCPSHVQLEVLDEEAGDEEVADAADGADN